MSARDTQRPDPERIEATAAVWLSLRDRGMTESETGEFMRWLQQSPRHAEVFGDLDGAWRKFDRVAALRPTQAAAPQPALLAPRPRVRIRRSRLAAWGALAAAAALTISWLGWRQLTPTAVTSVGAFQKLDLPDGSVVQLNTDSAIKVRYSDRERRVDLLRGEAHFDVAKNPARPFVVAANHVAVRAVGTAFNVRLLADAVDVLVTEGKVQVNDVGNGASLLPASERSEATLLGQGERVRVPLAPGISAPRVPVAITEVAPIEIQRALAWQERRLQFEDMLLTEVVAEFNRYNRLQLVVADPALHEKRFSGTFRADGYEPFVRLLEENFSIVPARVDGAIELRAAK
jgi:transmembrane sensor